jgi:hypothetical protein
LVLEQGLEPRQQAALVAVAQGQLRLKAADHAFKI